MKVLFATDGSAPAREGELLVTRLFNSTTAIHTFTVAPELRYEWLGPVDFPNLRTWMFPLSAGTRWSARLPIASPGMGLRLRPAHRAVFQESRFCEWSTRMISTWSSLVPRTVHGWATY